MHETTRINEKKKKIIIIISKLESASCRAPQRFSQKKIILLINLTFLCNMTNMDHYYNRTDHIQYILVYPALDYPAPRLTGPLSLLLKGEKALSNKPPSFRFSAIVLMKVKLFNNLFC